MDHVDYDCSICVGFETYTPLPQCREYSQNFFQYDVSYNANAWFLANYPFAMIEHAALSESESGCRGNHKREVNF